MDDLTEAKIARLQEAVRIDFGPGAFYQPLIGDGDTSIRTGIQTCAPGYIAPMHSHPYLELLFIIEGEADAWLQGEAGTPVRLAQGDCIALPPNVPHSFCTVGTKQMRLLGIHSNPQRIVNYIDRESDECGYPVATEVSDTR